MACVMLSFLNRQKMKGIKTVLQDKDVNSVIEKAKNNKRRAIPHCI